MSSAGKTDIVLGDNIHFPGYGEKSLTSQVVFVTGKRGSGKSWTTGAVSYTHLTLPTNREV